MESNMIQKRILADEANTSDEPLAKRPKKYNEKVVPAPTNSILDKITKNPGLQHISEDIFKLLGKKSLMDCRLVNHSLKNILDQPKFWFEKLKKDEKDLLEASEENPLEDSDENSEEEVEEIDFAGSLKNLHQNLDDDLQHDFVLVLMSIYERMAYSKRDGMRKRPNSLLEIVVDLGKTEKCHELMKFILDHVDPYSKINLGQWPGLKEVTPIHLAAWYGIAESVEKLINKYDTPLVKTKYGRTPFHLAAMRGHANVIEFLAPLTDTPNAGDHHGMTPFRNC